MIGTLFIYLQAKKLLFLCIKFLLGDDTHGDRYRLEIVEQKTGKQRVFTVPLVVKQYIENFCLRNGIGARDRIFPLSERAIQKQLSIVCDYLGYEGIGCY